jgi:hypothetical protein
MANQTPKGLLDSITQLPKGLLDVDMDQAIKDLTVDMDSVIDELSFRNVLTSPNHIVISQSHDKTLFNNSGHY